MRMPSTVKRYIEELPEGWKLERLNNVAELFGRIGWQGLTSDEYQDEGPWLVTGTDFWNGKVNWDSCVHISNQRWDEAYQIKLRPGDLLITKDGTVGKLAIVENQPGKASLNSGVMRIVPNGHKAYATKYLYYVLQTDIFKEWFKDINAGASTIQHLFQKNFKHFVFPMPPLEEQKRIVSTLNMECLEVDSILETLDKQADALERYRASIIHEAVTKGLNPDVPMKPSGIDWVGDIPEKWEINRLRYLVKMESGATPSKDNFEYWDGDIPWVSSMEVKSELLEDTSLHISEGGVSSCSTRLLPTGTLVMVVRSGILQHTIPVAMLGKPMTINQDIKALTFGPEMLSKYFLYFVKGNNQNLLKALCKDKSTVDNINQEYLKSLLIPFPSVDEQKKIIEYLDTRTVTTDAVLETKRKQIDVLKHRRQSLIYECVTGKRRVGKEI